MSELPPELFRRWLYTPEEDTDDEEVYRPADYPFPPTRAARRAVEFHPDGTYVEYRAGPGDRAEPRHGHWELADGGDQVTVRVQIGEQEPRTIEIVSHDASVLRVHK